MPRPDRSSSTQGKRDPVTRQRPGWIQPHFAAGSNCRLRENLETAELAQGKREENFFARKIGFIEAANSEKIFASGEEKRAGAQFEPEVDGDKNSKQGRAPPRDIFIGRESRRPARETIREGGAHPTDVFRTNVGIRIDENEDLAAGGLSTGVTRGGDLPSMDRNQTRPVLFCDSRGRIRRPVIDDNDFVWATFHVGRMVQRTQRRR